VKQIRERNKETNKGGEREEEKKQHSLQRGGALGNETNRLLEVWCR